VASLRQARRGGNTAKRGRILQRADRLWVPIQRDLKVKPLGREVHLSHVTNPEVKNAWSYTPTPHMREWSGV
jgi:hypothetical protein